MNKRKIICLMAAALLCFSAASCGDKEKPPVGSSAAATTAPTTAAETKETTVVTSAEATTEAETTAEAAPEETTAEAVTDSADDRLPDAVRLFEALNTADMMQAGAGVDVNEDVSREFTLKINESQVTSVYYLVNDSRFTNLDQVRQFVNDFLCGELLEKYKNIYDGENASFRTYNGNLYFTHEGRGSGFEYTGTPEITEAAADSFTAKVSVNTLGVSEIFTLKAVKQDEKWKASSLTVSKK
ncbi:MAG: hypothetical protein IKW96_01655 [Ruminococcus sp.]|uniref:hypothetical protein n=1 Tax=Ruminococcus sp. TaxID=41978 RepID=UPI0025E2026D|nr:hypothetical protein [Ruminococcus sp.]MBR5681973.1 hypothetical protein [Ruminococcus sp.]